MLDYQLARTINHERGSISIPGYSHHGVSSLEELIWVPCESRHRTVIYGTTVNLIRMREITQDLADLFGLRLPISLKK